jgi:hypothetical protein
MTSRTKTAMILLVLFGCCSTVEFLREVLTRRPLFQGQEEIAEYDQQRFERLKALLRGHVAVGFIEDNYGETEIVHNKRVVAQYVLAPVLVLDDPRQPLVIANIRRRGPLPKAPPGCTYRLLHDLGNGVLLLQTEPQ